MRLLGLFLVAGLALSQLEAPHQHTDPPPTAYKIAKHSFTPPYSFAGSTTIPYWTFGGHTVATDKFVRLTPDRQSRYGYIFNSEPCLSHNWEVVIDFRLHGQGSKVFGDGFAFWYTREHPSRDRGPAFGMPSKFSGFGLFFDTFDNDGDGRNPLVQGMLGDGVKEYDPATDGRATMLAECIADYRNIEHLTGVSIRYETGVLTIDLDIKGQAMWETCFRATDVHLPPGLYFGITSTTGDVADNHDILQVEMFDLGGANPYQITEGPNPQPYTEKSSRVDSAYHLYATVNSWTFWLAVLGSFAATTAVIVWLAMRYTKKKTKSAALRF